MKLFSRILPCIHPRNVHLSLSSGPDESDMEFKWWCLFHRQHSTANLILIVSSAFTHFRVLIQFPVIEEIVVVDIFSKTACIRTIIQIKFHREFSNCWHNHAMTSFGILSFIRIHVVDWVDLIQFHENNEKSKILKECAVNDNEPI